MLRIGTGITARVTQLAWMITLAALSLFIAFIIPEQKRNLESGLESKGQSILAALQGEVASAAVTEDYSAVVEHAMEVVAGDPNVEFIVLVKNDGYAVVVERSGWRVIQKIDPVWYGGDRMPGTSLGTVPLVNKRLFHYRTPLDCLGIPWGWMHVGLSLASYDRAVKTVYIRTGLLGVVCIVLSLVASMLFARRFVRPIVSLQSTVQKLAQGNFGARAEIDTHDEIATLGSAFNEMADAILQRNQIVECVRMCAQRLQSTDEWDTAIEPVIRLFGEITAVSRVLVLELEQIDGVKIPSTRLEWVSDGIEPYAGLGAGRSVEQLQLGARCSLLLEGQVVKEGPAELEMAPFICPAPPLKALIAAPIFANAGFWGALTLQDCARDREWSEVEEHSVRVIADMIGASIVRQRAQKALVAAKDELEMRVEERTVELKKQIAARDKAHADLKQAQQELIELSRISGMAEVATGVLHNVGNVLNSINVSATLLSDRVNSSRILQLKDLTTLLDGQSGNVGDFLAHDQRGQRVIPYLSKLSDHLLKERTEMRSEAESLVKHVAHVKEIVSMQQGYARNLGLLEKVTAEELMENALSISTPAILRHGIELTKDYQPIPMMTSDRHKVLQILLNLLQNAKDAVKAGGTHPRQIRLTLRMASESRVLFEVADNGVGISEDNLARIFSHGFTTKMNGHGFGLHSGALTASDLGGSLRVASAGIGHGSVFTLELPLEALNRSSQGGSIAR